MVPAVPANLQMIVAIAGAVLLPVGFGLPRGSTLHNPLVASGAFAGFTGAILFFLMFVQGETPRGISDGKTCSQALPRS